MHIIFFTHPSFLPHQSMPRYAGWLADGMKKRGHTIEMWTAQPQFFNMPVPGPFKKWMGYIDQFFVFPRQVKNRMKQCPADTLFVITDHALGPWVPLVAGKKHVIHCHDFLAQRSALGQFPENGVSKTGQQYQAFIRNGYSKGQNFISVSQKTRADLHEFLNRVPPVSEVVYNGVNPIYQQTSSVATARQELGRQLGLQLAPGYLLHVGGNQWYKNREGVIHLYTQWRKTTGEGLPLLMIGESPSPEIMTTAQQSGFAADIHFLKGLSDAQLVAAYNGASVFLFPSLAEGFGWPVAEAMACGCPVITTGEAPMTEVGADAAFYIPRKSAGQDYENWAAGATPAIQHILNLSPYQREEIATRGKQNIVRFSSDKGLDQMESIYKRVMQ